MEKMKRKLLTSIVVGAMAIGVNFGSALASNTLSEGEFSVGMEISYPPFASYDGDKVVGIDPELTALLSNKMGLTYKFLDNKFTSLILGLSSNKFDSIINGMYITEERLKKAEAIPYARTGAAIMVEHNSPAQPTTEKELCGLNVGLQQGTMWVTSLNELSESYCIRNGLEPINVQTFPTAPEVTQALMSKNVQAQLEIAGAAQMFVERTKGRIEISSTELIYPQTLGIYLKKGNLALKSKVEMAMAEIKADGSYYKLIKKYDLVPVAD